MHTNNEKRSANIVVAWLFFWSSRWNHVQPWKARGPSLLIYKRAPMDITQFQIWQCASVWRYLLRNRILQNHKRNFCQLVCCCSAFELSSCCFGCCTNQTRMVLYCSNEIYGQYIFIECERVLWIVLHIFNLDSLECDGNSLSRTRGLDTIQSHLGKFP